MNKEVASAHCDDTFIELVRKIFGNMDSDDVMLYLAPNKSLFSIVFSYLWFRGLAVWRSLEGGGGVNEGLVLSVGSTMVEKAQPRIYYFCEVNELQVQGPGSPRNC